MKRWLGLILVVALAALPVLHSHALSSADSASAACPACNLGHSYVVATPALAAPVAVAYMLTAVVVMTTGASVARTCSPRAPPLA